MASRTRPARTTTGGRTGPARRAATTGPAGTRARTRTHAPVVAALPIEAHRLMASVVLVLLMLVPLFMPAAPSPPNPAPFITPQIDGSGSVASGLTGAQLERAVFPYVSFIERTANSSAIWPDISTVLYYDPNDLRVRKAIVGEMYASSSGNLNQKLKDGGLEPNPPPDKLAGIESAYEDFLNDPDQRSRGYNGTAAMLLVRSFNATPQERAHLEYEALFGFQQAELEDPTKWQFTYNRALANLLVGNYAEAYEGFNAVISRAEAENNVLPYFLVGVAALRMGDPGEAIVRFARARGLQPPSGGNQAYQDLYRQVRTLGRQGLGDAQWANRDVAAAYKTYFETLLAGEGSSTLYSKWLQLGLQQRGYEGLLADLTTLASSAAYGNDSRVHHDRARLLTLLGRQGEALAEYRRALELGESDAGLHVSYGQALESLGDHDGALFEAQEAIRRLGKDPAQVDLSSVAATATITNTTVADRVVAQQLLDANLLRARVWGAQGNRSAVENLVRGITQGASSLPQNRAGLLNLYAGFAGEAAGMMDLARDRYAAAWDALKGLPTGSAGRAAALAGLARTSASGGNPQAGIEVLKANGYDPASPPPSVATDPDAPDILYQGALLLQAAGRKGEAANAIRVAAVVQNLQNARVLSGVGRPLWNANGTIVPSVGQLEAADSIRAAGLDRGLAVIRYKAAYGLDPALAAAWNNLGVLYARTGDALRGQFYLSAAGKISPDYALGLHNLASFAYTQGWGDFFTGEQAQGEAVKAYGPQVLVWPYELRYDLRGPIPYPTAPVAGGGTWGVVARLSAIVILALLLLHTVVGYDRHTSGQAGLVPTRGLPGRLALRLDRWLRAANPSLVQARSGIGAVIGVIAVPVVVGMLALAWGMGNGSVSVAAVFLPVALLACLLAFGANELVQYLAARRRRGQTLHHNWSLGVLLGVLGIPLGFAYGWQVVTRIRPATAAGDGAGSVDNDDDDMGSGVAVAGGHLPLSGGRRTRTVEELDLAQEARIEALADEGGSGSTEPELTGPIAPPSAGGAPGLSPAARIMFAGLAANLLIGLVFGVVYWLTGWPSARLALFASMLVLAFTSVSEPPADGWTLYRRNAPLWLALFLFAATMVTLLAVKMV